MRCSLRGSSVNSRGRQLKHCGLLTFFQERQQHDPTIREFQRVVMGCPVVLIDLSKDCGLVVDNLLTPRPHPDTPNFVCEGQLCAGQYANCNIDIFRRRKTTRPCPEVVGG
jgi:hypothetical protein